MRRLTAALAALATALGLALVVAAPANADWNGSTPTNGSTLRGGGIVLSASGGFDDSTLSHCSWFGGSGGSTRFQLINSSNAIVFEQFWNTGGSRTVTIDSRSYPNGTYTLRNTEVVRKNGGFLGAGCSDQTTAYNRTVTIDNYTQPSYTGATSAARNTSIPVSSTVTDASSGNPVGGITVTWSLTGGGSVSAATNASGVASASLPVQGSPRTATLTIGSGTTSYWRGTSITRSFEVTKNATATVLGQPATIVHGQSSSFTATVTAANGTGTPTGTVQFTVDGAPFGAPVAVNASGVATTAPSTAISTGTHTIGATYNGDSGFDGSSAGTKQLTINKAGTTTQLNAAPTPTRYGQAVTFTATVGVVPPGAGTPTGGVQFNIDGQPFGTAVPLTGGTTATLTISNLIAGNHDVEAVYNGDPDFAGSSSAVLTHGVERADTNLALTSSDSSAVSGQPLTYTATVSAVGPGAGTPGGLVQFEVDGQPLGAPVTLVNGQATSPTANLTAGPHQVTANYQGNSNYAGSDAAYTQAVAPAATTTTLTSSPNPSVFGQTVTLRAEVTVNAPGTGTPAGAIRFVVDGATLQIVDLNANGVAELQTSALAVGPHSIKAHFLTEDTNYNPSQSPTGTQQVNKAATKTVVSSSSANSVFGQPVTFTADVSVLAPGAGSPSGTVTFADGSTPLATVNLNSAGQATFTTGSLGVGQHAITATYDGDGSFLGSNGSATQTVMKASTSTVVTSSNNPALTGQSTVFTAQIGVVAPGAGTPSGTVLFTVNGLPLGGQRPVVDGVATSPAFAALTPGNYKVKAQYSGDGNFFRSDGLLDQGSGQFGVKGSSSLTVTGPADVAYNGVATFDVTVKSVAPATGTPSGVVRFWEGGELLGSTSLQPGTDANTATGSFAVSTLAPGQHAVRAEYVGNYNFNGAENTTSVVVGRAPTSVGISSSANPATFGDTVTLTATVNEVYPAAGAPTGTVVFKEGSTVLGTGTISTVGGQQVASVQVAGLHGGAHQITAVYSGDTTFGGSTSPVFTQQVAQQSVTLVAGDPRAGYPLGTRAGYVRARLTDASGAPLVGRTITFTSPPFQTRPTLNLCSAVTDSTGLAECDDTVINIDPSSNNGDLLIDINGTYDATYAGSSDYQGATARGHLF